jgi:hypothetical protein
LLTHFIVSDDVERARRFYREWSARGAEFLTPPIDRGVELRCYMRDPDGRLIEVGQATGLLEAGPSA